MSLMPERSVFPHQSWAMPVRPWTKTSTFPLWPLGGTWPHQICARIPLPPTFWTGQPAGGHATFGFDGVGDNTTSCVGPPAGTVGWVLPVAGVVPVLTLASEA